MQIRYDVRTICATILQSLALSQRKFDVINSIFVFILFAYLFTFAFAYNENERKKIKYQEIIHEKKNEKHEKFNQPVRQGRAF